MKRLNLYLAVVWFALGGVCVARPDLLPPVLQAMQLQLAVFAGAMVCYNMTRWWLIRAMSRRDHEEPVRPRHAPRPVDPIFDLGDEEDKRSV